MGSPSGFRVLRHPGEGLQSGIWTGLGVGLSVDFENPEVSIHRFALAVALVEDSSGIVRFGNNRHAYTSSPEPRTANIPSLDLCLGSVTDLGVLGKWP